jgi:hypothetical protein
MDPINVSPDPFCRLQMLRKACRPFATEMKDVSRLSAITSFRIGRIIWDAFPRLVSPEEQSLSPGRFARCMPGKKNWNGFTASNSQGEYLNRCAVC